MATVYLADDLKHQRKVALKVLKPELVYEGSFHSAKKRETKRGDSGRLTGLLLAPNGSPSDVDLGSRGDRRQHPLGLGARGESPRPRDLGSSSS
jgi:hypothetical protein